MASSSSTQEIVEYEEQRERSAASQKLYDAFISHRGPDVKDTLAKQLYKLLQERGCRAFLDREEIEGGDSIPFAINNGICSSVVQIAIFSKRYAESKWCLDELVLMLAQTDALFIPVFYEVNPWELRHTEKGAYTAAFSDYRRKERYLDKLDEWKSALEFAADISGYELSEHKDNLCEKIVSRVLQEMEKRIPLHVAKYPVRLSELVQDFERSCLKTVRDRVTMVGIFGLGGSGKTTLAKELFNRKRSSYNASCFLSDVRESHTTQNLNSLQSQLFKDLFNENRVFRNVDEGIGQLKHRLGRARHLHFFIVLDDIDHRDQLDALLPEAMLSSGSLAMITTRDQGLLTGADIRYKMKEMNRDHAEELFCSHAFRGRDAPIAYKKLVESFVKFCGGLPLSLKVLGAHVYGRDAYYWELQLEKVKDTQPKDIMQRLKISFDGLDSLEQQIFMDIACLFNKKEMDNIIKIATSIWNGSRWFAEHAVQTLQDKCLVEVTVKHRHFQMHDHLRDLGRQIADDLGPPRLWRPDILRSMEAKGFKQTLVETKGRCLHSFKDSFLQTNICYFVGSSNDSAETELLLLHFGKIKIIPSWIPVQKLLCLSVSNTEELWSTFQQQLQINTQASFRLRILHINCSPSLQNLPDLMEKLSQLEELRIIRSLAKTDITSFIQSLKQLSNLRSLQLSEGGGFFNGNLILTKGGDSTNLEASTSSRMKSLETIKIRRLDQMSMLLISGNICPRLRLLEVLAMRNLNEMDLQQLERLDSLIMKHCPKVETIAGLSSLTGLRVLYTMECERLRSLPNLAHLCYLERITIVECYQLQSVQGVEELQGLKSLEIGVGDSGDASVLNCIYGLKVLPSNLFSTGRLHFEGKATLVIVKSESEAAVRAYHFEREASRESIVQIKC
ncbi:disease resistance protein Roq1 isoform X2 [Cryptomeria japonica]|uniref:disease resistance protein Roq1 isoform X2 n=1 Tax=Cryptomeria japonica TaxID=3369 RepID=UPI0027DAB302|nr:disease resistance protein Roq1 isoform X2 [Cryptomeria japonica]